jgi:hypothetical protein
MNGTAYLVYGICSLGSLSFIATALHFWGAAEIRKDAGEVVFLSIAAAAWLFITTKLFPWFGLSLRDDVAERKNVGALFGLCGALIAVALLYAGGSIGEGPSYMNNVFSVGIAALVFFALWILLEGIGKVSISITEERDAASGLRLFGILLALGLVLGRAVAGDWHSASATLHDFIHDGWPAAVIGVLATCIELFARPNREHPFRQWLVFGLLPAIFYIALAALWLWRLGPWEGMPQ